jgi:hypothetical protein
MAEQQDTGMVRDPGVLVAGISRSAMPETSDSNGYLQNKHKPMILLLCLRMT